MNIHDWLSQTQAKDLMTRETVSFAPSDSLSQIAAVLLEKGISGGPVISDGRCVGVVSASDLVAAEEEITKNRQQFALSGFGDSGIRLPVSKYEDKLAAIRARIAPTADQPVERFMSTQLVTVRAESSIAQVIQKIVDAHIHRVVVVDEQQQLLGLITTIDVLQALTRARSKGSGRT